MSDEFDEIVHNLKQPSSWVRLLFMAAFAVVLYIILMPVVIVLTIAQALFSVLKGEPNPNLRYFGLALEEYIGQVVRFLSYNSEHKPFPFSDFPQIDDSEIEQADAEKSEKENEENTAEEEKTSKPKSTAKKKSSTVKKPSAKKKAVKKTPKKAAKKKQAGDSSGETSD